MTTTSLNSVSLLMLKILVLCQNMRLFIYVWKPTVTVKVFFYDTWIKNADYTWTSDGLLVDKQTFLLVVYATEYKECMLRCMYTTNYISTTNCRPILDRFSKVRF